MSYPKDKVANESEYKTSRSQVFPAAAGHGPEKSLLPKSGPEPLEQITCRLGDRSCAQAHASTLKRSSDSQPSRRPQAVLNLQRNYGNQFVGRVLKESLQTSRQSDRIALQAQEEEEESMQAKPETSEIQRQAEDEEEKKKMAGI
jgi:hypothetical protein